MAADVESVIATVKRALDAASVEYERIDESSFYITSGLEFPFWITADSPNLIRIHTYVRLKEEMDGVEEKAIALAHNIMLRKMPNMVVAFDGKLHSIYYLPCMGGVSSQHIIEMLGICAESFVSGVRELDVDDIVP